MSNNYKIPAEVEQRIRDTDKRCVYCGKLMKKFSVMGDRSDMASIEHFREEGPFYWDKGLKEEDIGICCISCNSSRGRKSLSAWFKGSYCTNRNIPINEKTVADSVRKYIERLKK